jgi:hypothetical protein
LRSGHEEITIAVRNFGNIGNLGFWVGAVCDAPAEA